MDTQEERSFPEALRRACRNGRRAFTLLELLVVIAVIAILAALLLPVLARAKGMAKRVQCISNQRQLAAAWAMYAGENSDWLAANGAGYPPNPTVKLWVQGAFYYGEANTNWTYLLDSHYALFADYIRTTKIYLCPTDKQTVAVDDQTYPKLRSYALNVYLGWVGHWDFRLGPQGYDPEDSGTHPLYTIFKKDSQLAAAMPAGVFLFQDVNPNSICWPYFGVEMAQEYFFNWPNSSHNRGGVVSFADGHVDYHRWRDQRTITAYSTEYHEHRDYCPNNPDLAWLQEHTSMRN